MFLSRVKLRKDIADVALVSSDQELQQRLRSAFKHRAGFEFCSIDGPLSHYVSHFSPASGPSVLIAHIDGVSTSEIAAVETLRRQKFEGAIIAISDGLDANAVRSLLHCRICDWLPAGAPTEDVVEACENAVLAKRRPDRPTQFQCISFVPAAGGVGTTTLAIQSGFLLAQQAGKYESTCLVDLNFQSGALADYLDLQPGLKVSSVEAAPERLDTQLLQVMLTRHSTGLAVLAPPRSPVDCPHVDAKLVAKVLGVASEMFDTMIIDLPPTWQPWTNDVLAGSDQIYVVTEFTVPALRKAQELVTSLQQRLESNATKIKVIVNKYRRGLFTGGLSKRDASQLLNNSLAGFVSEDYAMVREAINRGHPISVAKRSNRVSRELGRIVTAA